MNLERDRLIDMLLQEELGGARAPDLAAKILSRARRRRPWLFMSSLASAAAIFLILVGWWFFAGGYPNPAIEGGIVAQGPVQRGTVVHTQTEAGKLRLGGYVQADLRPHTTVHIAGTEHAEEIFLQGGEVDCTVAPGIGKFAVQTPVGQVSVVGTQFQVRVFDDKGEGKVIDKRMMVRVLVGAVLVSGAWGTIQLGGGEQHVFGQDKKEVKKETKKEEKAKDPLEGKKGTTVGQLVAKGEAFIEVKADGEEKARKYFPEWKGGAPAQGGGFDKATLKSFRETTVGSRVEIEWVFHERLRALNVKVLKAAETKKDSK